ncbi:hypothetical protein [Streptomyces alboflavus]|uniref:hypothetical protein n=1 Tax=Streptomyces alboflavus TaxID=67267 RepID=UPI00131BA000
MRCPPVLHRPLLTGARGSMISLSGGVANIGCSPPGRPEASLTCGSASGGTGSDGLARGG